MKTSHTICTSFAKRLAIILTLLLTLGVTTAWAAEFSLTNETIKSNRTGKTSYGNYTIGDHWGGKWLINLNSTTYSLQLGYNTSSSKSAYNSHLSITIPQGASNISILIKTNNSTTSGRTFYACSANNKGYVNSGNGDYGKASTTAQNGSATIQITGAPEVVYIYPNGTAYIEYVTVTYDDSPACSYIVTFNSNYGTNATSSQEFTCGETKALAANSFSRTGYTFARWNTKADGTGISYTNQQSVNLSSTNNDNFPLYAQWTANKYTVQFNANGGTGTMNDQSFTYDIAQNLTANAFEKYGHTFAGWSKTSNGSIIYTDGQSVSNLTSTNTATVTLYAKWTENPPQIIYADLRILIDDIDDVRDVFSGYADVSESGDAIVIKLTSNILGRIYLNNNDGNFILDLNDNTLDPATEYDQPICADHNFTGSLTITGSGSIFDGKVEHCVVFRKVRVGAGAVVKNTILMEGVQIGEGCVVENAILDKDVVLSAGQKVIGASVDEPAVLKKGTVL